MSNYSEKLKDPRWQKKRLEIFQRDNFTCRFCGDKEKTLVVHHLEYIRGKSPWEYDNHSLITICENCHNQEYEFRRETEIEFLHLLSVNRFSWNDIYHLMWDLEKLKKLSEENAKEEYDDIKKHISENDNG